MEQARQPSLYRQVQELYNVRSSDSTDNLFEAANDIDLALGNMLEQYHENTLLEQVIKGTTTLPDATKHIGMMAAMLGTTRFPEYKNLTALLGHDVEKQLDRAEDLQSELDAFKKTR